MSARLQAGTLEPPKNNRKPTPRIPVKIDSQLRKQTTPITLEKEKTTDQPEVPKLSNIEDKVQSPTSGSSGRHNKKRPFTICRGKNFTTRRNPQTPTAPNLRAKSLGPRVANDKVLSPKFRKDAVTRQNENSINKGQSVCTKISEEAHGSLDDKNVGVNSESSPQMEKRASVKNIKDPVAFEEISLSENGNVESESGQKAETDKENDSDSAKPDTMKKMSKIPRAKTAVLPVTCEMAKLPVRSKSKNSIDFRPTGNQARSEHYGTLKKEYAKKPRDIIRSRNVLKYEASADIRRLSKLAADTEKDKTSGMEADEEIDVDFTFTSTDESPALLGSAGEPSATMNLRKLKNACRCKSCSSHKLEKSWKELRSSPDLKSVAKNWIKSSKNRKYTSTEDLDLSSDSSNESVKRGKRSSHEMPNNGQTDKDVENNSTKIRPHRQTRFSFFNALFDIVFWPFLFLRTDR